MNGNRDVVVRVFADHDRPYHLEMESPTGEASARIALDRLAALPLAVPAPDGSLRDMGLGEQAGTGRSPQQLGRALFETLFAGETFRLLRSSRDQAERAGTALRLVLHLPPELAALPWELMFDDSGGEYFCLRSSLIRYVRSGEPVGDLGVPQPVRVLGMSSVPSDLAWLDADGERERLESAVAGLSRRGLLSLRWVDGSTWEAAQNALMSGCDVFHFIGHGSFDPAAKQGTIFFTNGDGSRRPVTAPQFKNLMRYHRAPPRLVVLNSCQTATGVPAPAFTGIGPLLVGRIPAVVAMQFTISDAAAIAFSVGFYGALVNGVGVDEAVRVARLEVASHAGTFAWATPVLYLRSRGDQLFLTENRPMPREEPRFTPPAPVTPAQLPAAPSYFTGRRLECDALEQRRVAAERSGRPLTLVIGGPGGVGKTVLALRWAHEVRWRFPDGQLYVDLGGFGTGPPTDPAEALRGFLHAFGIDDGHIPGGGPARAALLRSVLATKRVLIVLDNAVDSAHVRPLLPAGPGTVTLITSRNQLGGLVSDGADFMPLGYLPYADARALLALRLGEEQLDVDPAATKQVLSFCAGLPLALCIVAARARLLPAPSLASLRDELADEKERLDGLSTGETDTGLRAVFSSSYQALPDRVQRVFRLLGVNPGPDVGVHGAAALADLPVKAAQAHLRELARCHLVEEYRPRRYRLHDLMRLYAVELADELDGPHDRREALRRLMHYYVDTGSAAQSLLVGDPATPVQAVSLRTAAEASAWFEAEDAGLLAATMTLAAGDFAEFSDRLAWAVDNVWVWRGRVHEVVSIWRNAVEAAERHGDIAAQARANRFLGLALLRLAEHEAARRHLERALTLFAALGDPGGQAAAQLTLATVHDRLGETSAAADLADGVLVLYQQAGLRRGEAHAFKAIGSFRAKLGMPAEGLAACARSLRIFRQLGDVDGQADALDDFGRIHQRLGRHRRARRLHERALELYAQVGDDYGRADALLHLGDALHAGGEGAAAMDAWRQAADLFRTQGRHHKAAALDAL